MSSAVHIMTNKDLGLCPRSVFISHNVGCFTHYLIYINCIRLISRPPIGRAFRPISSRPTDFTKNNKTNDKNFTSGRTLHVHVFTETVPYYLTLCMHVSSICGHHETSNVWRHNCQLARPRTVISQNFNIKCDVTMQHRIVQRYIPINYSNIYGTVT